MANTLRARRRQMLREEILEAAAVLLSEKGYATMSMDELAARVGVSKPTLYTHFPTKNDLVVAASICLMEHVVADFENDRAGRSPLDHLAWLLRLIVQRQIDAGALSVQIWMPELIELLRQNEEAFALMRQIDAYVLALVQEAIAAGEINPALDAAAIGRAFHALAKAPFFAPFIHLGQSGAPDENRIAEMMATLFRNGIAAVREDGGGASAGI